MQKVAVVMGSSSDWPTMQQVATQLTALEIPYEKHVISAHRMPDKLAEFGKQAANQALG